MGRRNVTPEDLRRRLNLPTLCREGDDDEPDDRCSNPGGHSWVYSGTQYGGDDESYHGEGRCYCEFCGADGDA